jgi:tetratricopeptide (TPR) repeat protein
LPSGGTPALNPAGSSARGYVRITQGRVGSILPSRPSASANTAERAAAAAARGGSTAQAIDGLTNAINANSGDAGFRFQQRAQLFLSQGDYARAADDFQSAISAYNEQINRGDQVASARAGLRAARSGLNLALAGGR